MQTTAIRTVANSLPQNEVILLTLLISKRYIPYTELRKIYKNAEQKEINHAKRPMHLVLKYDIARMDKTIILKG